MQRRKRPRRITAIVTVAVIIGTGTAFLASQRDDGRPHSVIAPAGTTLTPPLPTTPEPTTTTPPATTLPTPTTAPTPPDDRAALGGTYTNGDSNIPHYTLSLALNANNELVGVLEFHYQDGKTSTVLSILGVSAANGTAILTTDTGDFTLTYTQDSITWPDCQSVMTFALSDSACTLQREGT